MQENHKKFLNHLDKSSDPVFIVARYIYDQGFDVRINALQKAKRYADWKQYKDDGDIYMYKDLDVYRIEVKQYSKDFTGSHDYPYPNVLICAKHSYDNATPKPYAYMLLNKNRTHMGIVNTETFPDWKIVTIKDSRYDNYKQQTYAIEPTKIKWVSLNNKGESNDN